MSTVPLPVTTPRDVEVDAAGVLGLIDALEGDADISPHSLMVLRHGRVLAAGWWAPYSPERRHLLYSLSKTFTATALGLAVAEGRVGLDDLVVDLLPDLAAGVYDPVTRSLRVRHLVTMATGHAADTWVRALEADPDEPVRGFLGLPSEGEPGSVFAYNQSATYTLAALLQRLVGSSLTDYLRPRLLDPLGIGEVSWQQHPPGRDLGFSGLFATTDAVARLGQLLLDRGRWDGRQLLTEQWVAEATRRHVDSPAEPHPDWRRGYGFQLWQSRHGYRGDGAFGQFCLVLPDHDVVVALTAGTEAMQSVLDAVWTHLVPAVGRAPSAAADAALGDRLARLVVPGHLVPPGAVVAPGLDGAVLLPAGTGCAAQPSLSRVEVSRSEPGWRVRLVESPGAGEEESWLDLDVTGEAWSVSGADAPVPTAVSGGTNGSGDLVVRVLFLETPHELVLTCTLEGFHAAWSTAPMDGPPLHRLAAPRPG